MILFSSSSSLILSVIILNLVLELNLFNETMLCTSFILYNEALFMGDKLPSLTLGLVEPVKGLGPESMSFLICSIW